MHRTARLLTLAGGLALGVGLLLLWWLLANDPPVAAIGGSTQTPAAGGADPASALVAGDEATRVAVALPPAAARGFEVRGRCLAAESGEPIAGATVQVTAGEDTSDADDAALAALASTASGSDGRFACTVALPSGALRLVVRATGRNTLSGRRNADLAGELWDVGDVLLPLNARVRGEVVDATGDLVPEAEVSLVRIFMERPTMTFRDVHHATTDARGAFVIEREVAAGEWFLAVEGTGALRAPRKTEVPAGGEHFVHIEVERPDPAQAIRGRVVDRQGQPIAGVSLSATGEGSAGRATSRADGTFVIHRGAPRGDTGKRGVDLFAQAPQLEQLKAGDVAWGQHGVEVVMQPLATVVVRAIDERNRPVHAFDILHARLAGDGLSLIDYAPAAVVIAGDGSVQLTALRSGAHVLLLRPHGERLAVAGPIPFAVDDASSREVLVHVPDCNETEVEVVDTAGAPVPACELDLIAAMARAPVESAMPAPRVAGLRCEGLRGVRQVSLAHGRTDAQGIVRLDSPPGSFSLFLRCETHLPLLTPVTIAGTASRLRLVMEAAAVLHGRLVPAAALRAFAPECDEAGHGLTIVARRLEQGTGAKPAVEVARAEVAPDGTFRLGALPPGTVRILLRAWLRCSDVHAAAMLHELGELDVTAGTRLERDFAVDAFLPATASGLVLLDAEPVQGQQFFLQRVEPAPRLGVRIATDTNGRFHTRLPPGLYQPQLAIPAQPGPGYVMLPLPQRCAIGAGASEDLRIEGRARRLRLRVLGSDGAPLGNRRIRIDNKNGYYRPGALATDTNGVVELQPAPYGAFFLFAADGERAELTIGPLELPPGDGAVELDFRVGG